MRGEMANDLEGAAAGEYDFALIPQSNFRMCPALHLNSKGGPQYAYS